MADFLGRLAMPVLKRLEHGAWENFCKDEDTYGAVSWRGFLQAGMGLGVAIARGWAEQKDETWARITPVGRETLAAERGATEIWLVWKGGYFYRPNAQGYTEDINDAGRFTYERALALCNVRGVSMHKVSEWPDVRATEAAHL